MNRDQYRQKGEIVSVSFINMLTDREKEVLALASEGKTNKEIAQNFFYTEGTVKQLFNRIFGKLGAKNRVEAIKLLTKVTN